jgi:hypothetical protein
MNWEQLEKIILEITCNVGFIPPQATLVNSGLTQREASSFQDYLKQKGYNKLNVYKDELVEQAKANAEAHKMVACSRIKNALSANT